MTPHLDKYPNAELLWCQEEPLNNGAWTYVGPRILTAANETAHHKGKYPAYAGRPPYSSVATGSKVGVALCEITKSNVFGRRNTRRKSHSSWIKPSRILLDAKNSSGQRLRISGRNIL